jgi:rhomboid family GlyGly-CTERM serine protease
MNTRFPYLTLVVAGFAMALHCIPGATDALEFNRLAIVRGEGWRFFTAHCTHFETNHLIWDLGVWLVLGTVCEAHSRRLVASALVLASVAITAAVWWWQPRFEVYRGLSGLDCALFGLFAGSLLRGPDRAAKIVGALGLLVVLVKCGFELATGTTLFTTGASYAPVPLAHLVGVVAGTVVALSPSIPFRTTSPRQISGSPSRPLSP